MKSNRGLILTSGMGLIVIGALIAKRTKDRKGSTQEITPNPESPGLTEPVTATELVDTLVDIEDGVETAESPTTETNTT